MSGHLSADLEYEWLPFTLAGVHLPFREHRSARLTKLNSSWWGPAIYKWEGRLAKDPALSKRGVLIGETSDLRQRVKQYVRGTQERGNKLWRETFLELGDIYLYTLDLKTFVVGGEHLDPVDVLASANKRLLVEQLLVLEETAQADPDRWVVNARK